MTRRNRQTILVTGGAGFIGSAFVRRLLSDGESVVVLDALTYSGRLENLREIEADENYEFVHGSITDRQLLDHVVRDNQPDAIINFAAESHVDRSIDHPGIFIDTNINGVFVLLEVALNCWQDYVGGKKEGFRFLQVSTDEVFGSFDAGSAVPSSAYRPNSPYSASKASGDMLVRAYHKTYGLPVLTTYGSNTYGPRQFPEKFLPLMILRALSGMSLPIYGDGSNVREWLHVEDHVAGIVETLRLGESGQAYNIGSGTGVANIDVAKNLCRILDESMDNERQNKFSSLIEFVEDRPGHDFRYALDISGSFDRLGWAPQVEFESGLRETVKWYMEQRGWWEPITEGQYSLSRLGIVTGTK